MKARGAIIGRICSGLAVILATGILVGADPATPALKSPPVGPSPKAWCNSVTDQEIVPIPSDWKDYYPFSARYSAPEDFGAGDLVIDLKAARFRTAGLSVRTERAPLHFVMPDLSTFAPELRSARIEGGYRYVVVQAATPQDQIALRKHLEQAGMAILDYLPNMAYLVRVQAKGAPLLQAMPEVFWAGDFVPAFRVDSELDFVIEANPEHWMELLALFDRALYATAEEVASAAAASGATVRTVDHGEGGEWIVRLEGQAQAARSLVQIPGCLWTERYTPFELHNNMARTSSYVPTGRGSQAGPIMDVESVWAKGIHGEGQIASAADTGLSTGVLATLHKDFGDQSDPNNPMRVIKGYAIGRINDWSDDQMNTTDSTRGGHGTHTSGSIVGNGFRSGSTPSTDTYPATCYAGVAPKAQFVIQSLMTSTGGLSVPADLNNLFSPPYGDGARVHSNSWGNTSGAGTYTTNSKNVDLFTWNNKDMVITFSAGNSGTDRSPADGIIDTNSVMPPATAKNCITVGASEDYHPDFAYEYPQGTCNANPTWNWFNSSSYAIDPVKSDLMADNANGLGAFSSRGPLADSRIKPDLVAPGISVISTRTDKNQGWEQWGLCGIPSNFQPYYLYMGGTSMANPLTAGSAVLVREYYVNGWHPNNSQTTNSSAVSGDGFNPSSALVKATLINGAWDMAPGQYGTGSTKEIPPSWDTGHDLPNNAEGYGRVDLMHSLFPGQGWGDNANREMEVHDVSPGLQTNQYDTYTVNVSSNANPLIVTLAWTDPYGATPASTELVNNLDLTATAPDGTVYYPNGLNKTSGIDNKNNVEQVKVTSPASGAWIIKVNGTAIPGNGVSGTTTQPYALVISGVMGIPCAAPDAPTLDYATGDCNGVNLAWTAGSETTASYNVYRSANTSCPVGTLTKIAGPITSTSYADTAAVAGTTYTYVVRGACDASGATESANSNCLAAARLAAPTVVYQSHGAFTPVDTNGNGIMEAGEKYSVQVTLLNTGTAAATDVTASLTGMAAGDGILVCNNPGFFGTIPAGGTASFTYTFVVDPSKWYGTYACGSNLTFNVVGKSATASCACTCNDEMAVFSSQVGAAGGTVTLFGPDDMGTLGNWTPSNAVAANGPAGYCHTRNAAQLASSSGSVGSITLTTPISTVGYSNIQVVADYVESSIFGTTTFSMQYSTNGTSWTPGYTVPNSTSWACNVPVSLPAGAAGQTTLYIRFTFSRTGWFPQYGYVDFVKITGTAAGTCGTWTAACPAAPLRVPYSVTPTKITTTDQGASGTVTWDVTHCPSTNYHIIYGKGENLATWTVDGGKCSIGTTGTYNWTGIPDPSTYTSKFLWWLVVGDDGASVEGSWGLASDNTERGGTSPSGVCSMTSKNTSTDCSTP